MASNTTNNRSISVIVSGVTFQLDGHLQDLISSNFPDSTLGGMLRCKNQLEILEPFEGPLPCVVQSILQYVLYKEWVIPSGVSPWLFLQELDFWMIPCDIHSVEYEYPQSSFAMSAEFGRILAEESSERSELEADQLQHMNALAEARLSMQKTDLMDIDDAGPETPDGSLVAECDSIGCEDSPIPSQLVRLVAEEALERKNLQSERFEFFAEIPKLSIFNAYIRDILPVTLTRRETPDDSIVFQSLVFDVLLPFFEKRLMNATMLGHGMMCISFSGSDQESVYDLSDASLESGFNLVYGLVPFLDKFRTHFENLLPLPLKAVSRMVDIFHFLFEWDEGVTELKKSAVVYEEIYNDIRVHQNQFILNGRYRFAIENENLFKKVLRCS